MAARFAVPVILIFFTLLVLLPSAPHFQPIPISDSSIFLYAGQRVLEGGIPYRDVWDHKGPLIYYIDALGLALGTGSRWGVWLLEAAFVFGAAWLAFDLMRKVFGTWPALFATVLMVFEVNVVLDGGNLVEEYGLLFQFLTLWLFWHGMQTHRPIFFGGTGAASALGFLLRPNIIAIAVSIGIVLLWDARRQKGDRWKLIGAAAASGLLVLAGAALFFYSNGALAQAVSAVFTFNFAYNAVDFVARWNVVQVGMNLLSPASLFAVAGWVFALVALRYKGKQFDYLRPLLSVLAFAMPLEILLASLPGRVYFHYFLSWLPIFSVLSAFFIYFLGEHVFEKGKQSLGREGLMRLVSLALLAGFALLPFLRLLPTFVSALQSTSASGGAPLVDFSGTRLEPALAYLEEHAPVGLPLLVWGDNVALNWLSGRPGPSRFVYQAPFFQPGYVSAELVDEYIRDLQAHPAVIIDASALGLPYPSLAEIPEKVPPLLRPLYEYIQLNYVQAAVLGRTNWVVYRFAGEITP